MMENKNTDEKQLKICSCKELESLNATTIISTYDKSSKMNQLDGITSWIVCLCVVMTNSILFGTMFIYGIFFPFLLKEFQESKSRTALVASLSMGVHTLIGPISSKICLTLGFRNAMILAGLVSASGLLGSSFAPNLYILYLGYGLALGFSVSVVYVGAFQIIPLYFDRHRFLATGVLAVGPGAGPLIMSTIVQAILDHIDWRKTMMVLAAESEILLKLIS
ncbi:Monocarboxylate transporter 14 [Exaiptasia diaphana]|nr:Monocarboxylate transporter 14 [Exaiptasia diaphana]